MRLLTRSAGRLSRHRRKPLAGLAVLLMALLITGGAYSMFSPGAQAEPTSTTDEDIQAGRELFLVGCSTCHGANGEGIPTVGGTQYGPSLIDVGAASVDFQVGTGRMPLAQPGQQAIRKPVIYDDDEIRQLAAYVDSLGTGPSIPDESAYTLPGDLTEEERDDAISRGGQIFLTNCTACHNFDGSGGAMPRGGFAPTLRGVESRYIYEALLTGPQAMPTFSDGNLTPDEKRDVIAYLKKTEETPGYGGSGLGNLGPVSEGLFAWLVGIGGLVGFAIWIAAHTTRSSKTKPSTSKAPVNLPSGAPATPESGASA
ncbi:c-type cytochrome [Nocardioides sp.]|uniref:cytochrome bc1 complex diheme cytochrome c subunit n=1 Tax=Nocardioides sp. TaxID=35761 RepID=UPI002715C787|nr:c-type cytochrome [Nocardioides sp.]MDO9458461.1 c-type cytochrome [Nocardioides sp.]